MTDHIDATQEDREALEPCPFCEKPLTIKRGCNPVAMCETEGCWLAERKISMPIDDPRQVASWNTRLASTAAIATERDALAKRVEALEAKVVEQAEELLWGDYFHGFERDGRWTHNFMSCGERLARKCGFDPHLLDYDAAAIRVAIPDAARKALGEG